MGQPWAEDLKPLHTTWVSREDTWKNLQPDSVGGWRYI